ncbi:MAG: universal stress protein [Deltaproteobacteria bacterium]|nr:universal stress protein [Deltaproteobacteria bacterium]
MARRIRRIMHATDFSKASGRALEESINLAKQNNAELLVVNVVEPAGQYAIGEDYGGAELYIKMEEAAKQDAERSMQKLMRKLGQAKVKAKSLLLKGIAYDQIVKAAKNRKADMIVIGTHGRTGISKLFMGSVAGKVISLARCPVLTVRGK